MESKSQFGADFENTDSVEPRSRRIFLYGSINSTKNSILFCWLCHLNKSKFAGKNVIFSYSGNHAQDSYQMW